MGNAFKLPGLRRYLAQSLGFEIERVEASAAWIGPEVMATPAFKDNILSFGVCYGLCLQGLGSGGLRTNLLPKEIIMDRLIRRKKPWAVAAAAVVMLACSLSFASYAASLGGVTTGWTAAEQAAKAVTDRAAKLQHECDLAKGEYLDFKKIGDHSVSNIEGRVSWLELLKAINTALPQDEPGKKVPENIWERNELHVTNLECQRVDDLAQWFAVMKAKGLYMPLEGSGGTAASSGPAAPARAHGPAAPAGAHGPAAPARPHGPAMPAAPGVGKAKPLPGSSLADPGPKGPGWIVQIKAHHYHNKPKPNVVPREAPSPFLQGGEFVRSTLLHNLVTGKVVVPSADGKGEETVSMKDLGIMYPVLVSRGSVYSVTVDNPKPVKKGGSRTKAGTRRPSLRATPPWRTRTRSAWTSSTSSSISAGSRRWPVNGTRARRSRRRRRRIRSLEFVGGARSWIKSKSSWRELKKHHFWVLALLIVVTAPVVWTLAIDGVEGDYNTRKGVLDNTTNAVGAVLATTNPPNLGVIKAIHDSIGTATEEGLKQKVVRAWKFLYEKQTENNPLPKVLDATFVKEFQQLVAGQITELSQKSLEQYQNNIPAYVSLPEVRDKKKEKKPHPESLFDRVRLRRAKTHGAAAVKGGMVLGAMGVRCRWAYQAAQPGEGEPVEMVGMLEWDDADLGGSSSSFSGIKRPIPTRCGWPRKTCGSTRPC